MKKLLTFAAAVLMTATAFAQGVYTRQCTPEELESAAKWVESGVWKEGFTKALPHESVNAVDW